MTTNPKTLKITETVANKPDDQVCLTALHLQQDAKTCKNRVKLALKLTTGEVQTAIMLVLLCLQQQYVREKAKEWPFLPDHHQNKHAKFVKLNRKSIVYRTVSFDQIRTVSFKEGNCQGGSAWNTAGIYGRTQPAV